MVRFKSKNQKNYNKKRMPIVTTTATESGGVGGYTKTTTTTAASHEPAAAAAAPPPPGFLPGYTAELDQIFEELLNHPSAPLPGFVAKVKRGADIYHKAFGYVVAIVRAPFALRCHISFFFFFFSSSLFFVKNKLRRWYAGMLTLLPTERWSSTLR